MFVGKSNSASGGKKVHVEGRVRAGASMQVDKSIARAAVAAAAAAT